MKSKVSINMLNRALQQNTQKDIINHNLCKAEIKEEIAFLTKWVDHFAVEEIQAYFIIEARQRIQRLNKLI